MATPIRQFPTTETNGQPSMSSTPAASAPESSLPTATPTMQLPRTETNGQPRMSNTPLNNEDIQDADNAPRVGKCFQSEEEAYQFYNTHKGAYTWCLTRYWKETSDQYVQQHKYTENVATHYMKSGQEQLYIANSTSFHSHRNSFTT